jgi:methyl-accepting chemotaxis protein
MTTASRQVLDQSKELKQITANVTGSMDDMTHGVDEISKTITRVQEITEENKENINALSTDTLRFKVE